MILRTARFTLAASILVYLLSLACGWMQLGSPVTLWLVALVAMSGMILSAFLCVGIQIFLFLRRRKDRVRG